MTPEQIGTVLGACVALISIITPLIRLNGLITRLTALLDQLAVRTAHCEERLDAHEARLARGESRMAALEESARQAHRRLDRLKKKF